MKIKDHSENVIDLEEKKEDKFWENVEKYLMYGIPAYDEKGHTSEVRFKVRPLQKDMVSAVQSEFEDGTWKSQAALYRSMLALGCWTALQYLKQRKGTEVEYLLFMLKGLNALARKDRLKEFKHQVQKMERDLMDRDNYDFSTKEFFDQIYKKFDKLGK